MIELYIRRFIPTFPSHEWEDELLYYGNDRDEAQRILCERDYSDAELAIWVEYARKVSHFEPQSRD